MGTITERTPDRGIMGFDSAFEKTIGLEGGYCNNPHDPGRETKYGISKRQYPDLDIKNLTLEQAKEIYYRDYWLPIHLDRIVNEAVADEIFDTGVNMGSREAVEIAQQALNFLGHGTYSEDGVMGPMTLSGIEYWAKVDPQALFRALNGFQFMRYVEIVQTKKEHTFARGWMKRIQDYIT
jgi:lysozyme family protein